MKLIEILLFILIFPLCLKTFSSGCVELLNIQKKIAPLEKSLQRDLFVSSSFGKLCSESLEKENPLNGKKISGWRKICGSFFPNENEINVTCEGVCNDKALLKCEWKNGEKVNHVFQVASQK